MHRFLPLAALVLALVSGGCKSQAGVETEVATPVSYSGSAGISVEEARSRVADGALLVCAYPDEAKCELYGIDPAISLTQLEGQLDEIGTSREILFYCACPDDATAKKRAAELRARGYRADFVRGGFHALAGQ